MECIIGGSAIALLQGLIIQQRLAIAPQWLLVSFASWVLIKASIGAIGWVATETLQLRLRLIHGCLQGAVVGLLLGVGQWFILRQQVKKASMWILANAASWAITTFTQRLRTRNRLEYRRGFTSRYALILK